MESIFFKHSILDFILSEEVTPDHIGFVGLIAVVIFIILGIAFIVACGSDDDDVLRILAIILFAALILVLLFIFNVYIASAAIILYALFCKICMHGWKSLKEDVDKIVNLVKGA